jgi:hypothetical protein
MTTRPRSELKRLKRAQPRLCDQRSDEEVAADERDAEAITKFFRAILQDGFKPDCRRLGRVRNK